MLTITACRLRETTIDMTEAIVNSNEMDRFESEDDIDNLELTPLRAHYLKRELVTLQFTTELSYFDSPEALSLLGRPFLPESRFINGIPQPPPLVGSPEAALEQRQQDTRVDLPFLRFVFHHFILSFPFLANCPPTFFSHKLQPLIYSYISRNISSSSSSSEGMEDLNQRQKISSKVEKKLGLIMSSAIKLVENDGKEAVVRIAPDGSVTTATPISQQTGFNSTDIPVPRPSPPLLGEFKEKVALIDFEINVVSVRNAVVKGRVMNKTHEEFIIRTRRSGAAEVYVSRRYGDFTRLAETVCFLL